MVAAEAAKIVASKLRGQSHEEPQPQDSWNDSPHIVLRCNGVGTASSQPGPTCGTELAGAIIFLIPIVFFAVIVLVMMRRSSRLQPRMDRSLELSEECARLAKEQVALQTETNRLLTRLIEAQARD